MTAAYAADIVTWRYPPPYDCYDMTSADPAHLTDPASGFFALVDGTRLTGFRSGASILTREQLTPLRSPVARDDGW